MSTKPVIVGRFGKTYGLQGWLRVNSFTEPQENILNYFPWKIKIQGTWQAIEVTASRRHGTALIAHIAGYDTPEAAKALTGKEIVVAREQLPKLEENEYYWADLEGLEVITNKGVSLGHVDYFMESGANDVMVVKGERECLIPYLPQQVILNIDLDHKKIVVDWDPDFE